MSVASLENPIVREPRTMFSNMFGRRRKDDPFHGSDVLMLCGLAVDQHSVPGPVHDGAIAQDLELEQGEIRGGVVV